MVMSDLVERLRRRTLVHHGGEMHVSNDPIPKNRMRQFHEILCATGGRYTSNPRDCGDVMRVDYAPGDYRAQNEAWRRVTAGVTEVRKDQWWRRMLRRVFSNVGIEPPRSGRLE